jgi:hypothetical protein
MIMSHNLVTEIKKMLTHSQLGTPITFHGDMSSIIINHACSGQMTKEPLQYVVQNPIPSWQLGIEVIYKGKCLRSITDFNVSIG